MLILWFIAFLLLSFIWSGAAPIAAILFFILVVKSFSEPKTKPIQKHSSSKKSKVFDPVLEARISFSKYESLNTYTGKGIDYISEGSTYIKKAQINNPQVYISKHNPNKIPYSLPHVIFTSLPIQANNYHGPIGYWPSYSEISPSARSAYIKWLASGKKDVDIDIGLVFIYYYGLEFRAIFEGKNRREILKEVIRLHEIYQFNNSFRGYSEGFITWLVLTIDNLTNEEKSQVLKITEKADSYSDLNRWGIPFNLQKKITIDGFTNLVASFPKTPRSKIPDKLGRLFKEHFFAQIKKDWPSIQKTIKVKKTLFQYHCATRIGHMFQKSCLAEAKILDIPTKLQNKLSRIWSQCIEDLRAYSRKAGKASQEELHSLLPDNLKKHYKHPLEDSIQNILEGDLGNPTTMGTFLGGIGRSYSSKISLKDSKVLCETLEHLKINIEPDARYSQKSYKWDQHVVFYKTHTTGIPKGANYSTACWLFDLGVSIANADNQIDDEELDVVEEFVSKKFCQTSDEKERVKYRKKLASAGALKGRGVAKKLADRLTGYELKPVGKYLFAIAAADGNISPEELNTIKKIFKDFELQEDTYNSLLNEFLPSNTSSISTSTLIQKGDTKKQTGSSIPEPDLEKHPIDPSENLALDKEALNRILENTYEVKEILEKTFNAEPTAEVPTPIAENTEVNRLTGNIKIFYDKIIQKPAWKKQELRQVAQELDLMLNSTIDQINHWADQTYGDYLIYEDEEFSVQKALIEGAHA